MQSYHMDNMAVEIEFLRQLSSVCPLYCYELNKLRHLAAMIIRHGGDLSHPMLCEKNRRVDALYLTACKNIGLLPFEFLTNN